MDESEVDSVPGAIPYPEPMTCESQTVYRTWKSPTDALNWATTILPDLTLEELQQLFDSVPAVNGKLARAFVEKVMEIATTF